MIRKINEIKNLGIFQNYTWENGLPEFKRYNLFYGCNGSGKTTISKLFASLNSGENKEFLDLEYKIELDDGNKIKNGQQFKTKIRVFNKQYIEDNIEIINGKAKPIFILGVENKELQQQIKKDEEELKKLEKEKQDKEIEKERNIQNKELKFTDVGKKIAQIFSLTDSGEKGYDKRNAKEDFKKLDTKALLNPEKIYEIKSTLKLQNKSKIPKLNFSVEIDNLYTEVKEICKKTVETSIIERLKNNNDIYAWVEQGFGLHKKHATRVCEFCNNPISNRKWKELIDFFNDADKKLKEEIDNKILRLQERLEQLKRLNIPTKFELYDVLHTKYTSRLITFNAEKINLEKEIYFLIGKLKEKKTQTTEELKFERSLSNNFINTLDNLNKVIKEHNDKTDNLQNEIDSAFEELKKHYLSEIFDEIRGLKNKIKDTEDHIGVLVNGSTVKNSEEQEIKTKGIVGLKQEIDSAKSKISSEHRAADKLNKNLATFLGREEIKFFVSQLGGYEIKRNEKIAKNLSEGEKTAIAFIYFVVNLQDKDSELEDEIVVIDDPVSSLDSNSLFQAFSFLKNAVKDGKQVFLFTHNFEFFKLLNNWLDYHRDSTKRYLIKTKFISKERQAFIVKIDKFLVKYNTEYEYLFSELYKFNQENKEDKEIEDVYHIPNIGRKVLETFLMFRIPGNESLSTKIKKLEDENVFDKNQLTAINKFFNVQSHITGSGFDPSLVQEATKNVGYLLDMINTLFQKHYEILESKINQT